MLWMHRPTYYYIIRFLTASSSHDYIIICPQTKFQALCRLNRLPLIPNPSSHGAHYTKTSSYCHADIWNSCSKQSWYNLSCWMRLTSLFLTTIFSISSITAGDGGRLHHRDCCQLTVIFVQSQKVFCGETSAIMTRNRIAAPLNSFYAK